MLMFSFKHFDRKWLARIFAAATSLVVLWPSAMSALSAEQQMTWGIDAKVVATAITPDIRANRYPREIRMPGIPISGRLKVGYTIDRDLQTEAQRLLQKHNPDYGMLVALDPDSGRILAMASSTRAPGSPGNLTMINTYPAASVAKIITAIAAVNEDKAGADTIIPFNGKGTSLYKKNVFHHRNHNGTRNYSFRKSFAKSVNSVFGRVGAVEVGGETMMEYARRLGFNGRFASDFRFANGAIELDTADDWQVVEMASGYTRRNTLSPLHGAALAATAVNGGHLVAPVVVEAINGPHGVPLYWRGRPAKSAVMREYTARQLKAMMRATVAEGTAKKSFRGFHRGALQDVIVGGKTGSLSGTAPKGKYDWFVGFGELGERKIAFAALCINKKKWYVKSSRLAREMLEFYFRDAPALAESTAARDSGNS